MTYSYLQTPSSISPIAPRLNPSLLNSFLNSDYIDFPASLGFLDMSTDSSPTDFAFVPPAQKTANNFYQYPSFSSYSTVPSTFSSTSSSFFNNEALPAISRDFTRPKPTETRRPATAGGAPQRPFGIFRKEEDDSMFNDPFSSERRQVPSQDSVDPHYVDEIPTPITTTTSATTGWTVSGPPLTSAPPNVTNFHDTMQHFPTNLSSSQQQSLLARPQTSDGLPSYAHNVSLPSARTLVGTSYYHTPDMRQLGDKTLQPCMVVRDARSASMSEVQHVQQSMFANRGYSLDSSAAYNPNTAAALITGHSKEHKDDLTFVALGGPTQKKRPRRRYDEIERLYLCGWNGCEKAYGTLNHLNAHVAMQKHGEKRLPSEFKEMRKAWRKKKREQQAQQAAVTNNVNWNRASVSSSGSEYDRRNSTMSDFDPNYHSGPYVSYGWNPGDIRPSTSSSIASSVDSRFAYAYPTDSSMGGATAAATTTASYTAGMMGMRRPSAPGHLSMPQQSQPSDIMSSQQFRTEGGDFPTPTIENPSGHRQTYPFTTVPTMPVPFTQQFAFQR